MFFFIIFKGILGNFKKMDKLPTEIQSIIWNYVYDKIEYDYQPYRLFCLQSEQIFQKFIEASYRNLCRESLCKKILKNKSFLGCYCCSQCCFEHLTSG